MNPVDVILILVLILVVFLAVRSIYRRKGTCSCGCENCSSPCNHRGAPAGKGEDR